MCRRCKNMLTMNPEERRHVQNVHYSYTHEFDYAVTKVITDSLFGCVGFVANDPMNIYNVGIVYLFEHHQVQIIDSVTWNIKKDPTNVNMTDDTFILVITTRETDKQLYCKETNPEDFRNVINKFLNDNYPDGEGYHCVKFNGVMSSYSGKKLGEIDCLTAGSKVGKSLLNAKP